MKIRIDIALGTDRVTARLNDGTLVYDDVGLVAIERAGDGRQLIAQIGAQSASVGSGSALAPALSLEAFQPAVSAGVVAAVAMIAWTSRRSKFKGLVAALDRVSVFVDVEGYETLAPEDRRRFVAELPYHPQISWWIAGQRLTY